MNIPLVIETLKELSNWLEGPRKDKITEIIKELENPDINEYKLHQLKYQLSKECLFHPKCLGDEYVPDFTGDGSTFAWWNYLSRVADICQNNL